MEFLDTGRYSLSIVDTDYVYVTVYTDQELTSSEAPTVLKFFGQFYAPVPTLVDRQGRYALSTGAQLAFVQHASRLFKAVAFLDLTPLQRRITKIASITYLKGLPVKSFSELTAAEDWLKQFGPLPLLNPPPEQNTSSKDAS